MSSFIKSESKEAKTKNKTQNKNNILPMISGNVLNLCVICFYEALHSQRLLTNKGKCHCWIYLHIFIVNFGIQLID